MEPIDLAAADIEWLLNTLAGLPLALTIVNTIARWDQGFDQLIAEMREEIIPTLTIGQTKVKSARAAFELSYRRLDDQSAQLFRSLGRSPQPFAVEAMAHMLDWARTTTGRAFRTLVQMGLADVEAQGNYRTHRLLHEYADILSREEDNQQLAVWNRRFAAYYLDATHRAARMWNQGEGQAALQHWRRALRHIERGCHYAARLKRPDWVLGYLESTTYYLGSRGLGKLVDRWQRRFEDVVEEQESEQWLWGNLFLGDAHLLLERNERAAEVLQRARRTAAESGDAYTWFTATVKRAQALLANGRLEEVLAIMADEAFATYATNLPSEDPLCIEAWSIIGMVYKMKGQYQAACYYFLKAWESAMRNEDRASLWAQARILLALAEVMMAIGNYETALELSDDGREIAKEHGFDILWSHHTFRSIRALAHLGQLEEAEQRLTELRHTAEDRKTLAPLIQFAEADVRWAAGRHQAAEKAYRKVAKQLAGKVIATDIWNLLGTRLDGIGQTDRATEVWQRARESGRRTGNQYKYLQATLAYAECLLDEDQEVQAHHLLEEVVEQGIRVAPRLAAEAIELLGWEEEAAPFLERMRAEQEAHQSLLEAPQRGLVTHSYFAVKQDGEWRARLLPGLGATKREAYGALFPFVGHPPADEDEGSGSGPAEEVDEEG
jgi:tetratricopeptide (TPR) repeat protein